MYLFLCDTYKDNSDINGYWISFYVTILQIGFDSKPQQIDKDAGSYGKLLTDVLRIVIRIGRRIFVPDIFAFKSINYLIK